MEVSIKDVANRAGVSISTVSRIMNHSATVSEKKVLAVKEAMEFYNYEPNQFARGLRKQASNMIGVYFLGVNRQGSMFESTYTLELLKGIERVLAYQNYSMVLISENSDYESRRKRIPKYFEFIKQKRIDGLLLSGLTDKAMKDEVFQKIMEEDYPVVYIGKRIHQRGLNVYAQFEQYMVRMVEILKEHGHRKVLLHIAGMHKHYLAHIMGRVQDEMPEMEVYPCILDALLEERELALQNVKEYVLRKGCTAVCTLGVEDVQMLLSICAELRISVPEQVSVISVEHQRDAGQFLYPRISSFYVPARDMGAGAAKLLINYIENKGMEEKSIEYETVYQKRDSIRRL